MNTVPSTMDVVRPKRSGMPKYLPGAIIFAVLALLAGFFVMRFRPAGVPIDTSTLITDIARRGPIVRSVTAQGVFAPEHVRVASATEGGVVDEILVKPGEIVYPGTPVIRMQNPLLEGAVVSARSQVRVALANLESVRQQVQAAELSQETALSDSEAQMQEDSLQAKSLVELHRKGLVSNVQYEQAQIQATKTADDVRLSRSRVSVASADGNAKVAAAQAQVDQAEAQLAADVAQVNALSVRAGTEGIVQSVDVEPGMSIAQNTEIARIADTRNLKAVLQVAESDMRGVAIGMPVKVDSGNGDIMGRVSRIAPAAQNGTVAVEVAFNRPLPTGTRPDASADGTIILASISDVVSIERPAGASDNNTIDVFRVVDNGSRAVRTRIRLGAGSNERVQVLSGIAPGDVVIISDMSSYLNQPELRLR